LWGGVDIKRPSARSSPYIGQVIPFLLFNQECGIMSASALHLDIGVVGNAIGSVGRR
jgi:hypothetical protein